MLCDQLTTQDQSAVNSKLREKSLRAKHELTLDSLINEWAHFTSNVTKYSFSIYDYENDLAVRKILDEIIESVSVDGRSKLVNALAESDNNFLLNTWSNGENAGKWNRYPKHLINNDE